MSAELDRQIEEYLDKVADQLNDLPEMAVSISCKVLDNGQKCIWIFQKQEGEVNGVLLNDARANLLISAIKKHFPEEKGNQ